MCMYVSVYIKYLVESQYRHRAGLERKCNSKLCRTYVCVCGGGGGGGGEGGIIQIKYCLFCSVGASSFIHSKV